MRHSWLEIQRVAPRLGTFLEQEADGRARTSERASSQCQRSSSPTLLQQQPPPVEWHPQVKLEPHWLRNRICPQSLAVRRLQSVRADLLPSSTFCLMSGFAVTSESKKQGVKHNCVCSYSSQDAHKSPSSLVRLFVDDGSAQLATCRSREPRRCKRQRGIRETSRALEKRRPRRQRGCRCASPRVMQSQQHRRAWKCD